MASRIKILGHPTVDHAYNVTTHVGPGKINNADDVQLVQFFISELLKTDSSNRGKRSGLALPTVSGVFDLATAYWIFEIQYQKAHAQPGSQIDGVVSPIVGSTLYYSPSAQWTIAFLNFQFQQQFPDRFDSLDQEPSLSSTLKASIAAD